MKFASPQEEILHAMSESTLGADFLFSPDNYGNDEPSDLAWLCEDIAVLFWCTRIKRSYQKANNHNLKQAKTWMGRWRRGQRLVGQNKVREFSAVAHDFKFIIALSVVDTADAPAEVHPDLGARYPDGAAVHFATLPESVVLRLARAGAGLRDFLAILTRIAELGGSMTAQQINRELDGYIISKFAQLGEPLPEGQLSAAFRYGVAAVQAAREGSKELPSCLVELDMFDQLWLAIWLQRAAGALAAPGKFGVLGASQVRDGPPFPFAIYCFANPGAMARWAERDTTPPNSKNLVFRFFYYLIPGAGLQGGMVLLPEIEGLTWCHKAADGLTASIAALTVTPK